MVAMGLTVESVVMMAIELMVELVVVVVMELTSRFLW